MQLTQEISVNSGLRSSFIDTRGGAVGSAIMALGDAVVLALTTTKCRSCGSGSCPETSVGRDPRFPQTLSTGRSGRTLALSWPGTGLALSDFAGATGRSP